MAATSMIVGIGASAGGLEALKALVPGLPADRNYCYVIAHHLSPRHSSVLSDLLRSSSKMPLKNIVNGQVPEPNSILVTTPNADVILDDGCLRLVEPRSEIGPKPSVDRLLETLAEGYCDDAIAIVLSGTGSDGAAGVRAIKTAGGVTITQDPDTAQYNGMPRSAIQTGCVDIVLPPARIGGILAGLSAGVEIGDLNDDGEEDSSYQRICVATRNHTGFALSGYRRATASRRILRRMSLLNVADMAEYAGRLEDDAEEARRLARDVLISVTSFFRDPECFESLRNALSERLQQGFRGVFRVWVPGCATGEEAYTIAILLAELERELNRTTDFLVFATDLDEAALEKSRRAVYPESSFSRVPPELVERYFEARNERQYQIKPFLRQRIVVAPQNVVDDPPFSRVDLVSCRNLMIYLERETQARILETFQYALNPRGLLFLGSSESVDAHGELFEAVDKRARVFRRKEGMARYVPTMRLLKESGDINRARQAGGRRKNDLYLFAARVMEVLNLAYGPPSVVVDGNDRIIHFFGDLTPYISLPQGNAELGLFELVQPGLRAELRALLHRCRREKETQQGLVRTLEGSGEPIRVQPVVRHLEVEGVAYGILSFESVSERAELPAALLADLDERQAIVVTELEKELTYTREELQTVVEELQTSNEELQSQGEELETANEELQSTNEELQTSNEELQSTNEELSTINDQLNEKSQELESISTALINIRDSLDFPLLVLDARLLITHFNSAAETLVASGELAPGTPLASLDWKVDILSCAQQLREVVRSAETVEILLHSKDQRTYRMRVSPFLLGDGAIGGVVASLLDETEELQAQIALREREALYRVTFEHSAVGMARMAADGAIIQANRALLDLLRHGPRPIHELRLPEVCVAEDKVKLLQALRSAMVDSAQHVAIEFRLPLMDGSLRHVEMRAGSISPSDKEPPQIFAQFIDRTSERQHTLNLEIESRRMAMLNAIALSASNCPSNDALLLAAMGELRKAFPECSVLYGEIEGGHVATRHCLGSVTDALADGKVVDMELSPMRLGQLSAGNAVTLHNLSAAETRDWSTALVQAGLHSALLVPMLDDDGLTGLLVQLRPEPGDWPELTEKSLRAVADLLTSILRGVEADVQRQEALSLLGEAHERLRITLAAIGDGVVTVDDAARISYMNDAARRLLGERADKSEGRPIAEVMPLISLESREPMSNPAERCLNEKRVIEHTGYETAFVNEEGRQIVLDTSAAPLTRKDGKIIGAVLVLRDVTHQRLLTDELSHRAAHDPLTGLANRQEFLRRLRAALLGIRQNNSQHALMLIDLDRFKAVNDTGGHAAGDELLLGLTRRLRKHLRSADLLARLGGDEFAVLLESCTMERAQTIADTLLQAVNDHELNWKGRSFRVGASIGLIPLDADVPGVPEAMARVDAACYLAKERGRGRVVISTDADEVASGRKAELALVRQIGRALETGDMVIEALPVLAVSEHSLARYEELLVRLPGEGCNRMPADFFPVAESFGLMPAVDRYVLEQALRHLASRSTQGSEGTADLCLGVNISGQSLSDLDFGPWLQRKLREYVVEPDWLCLEISEMDAAGQPEEVASFMRQFSDAGCRIALDRFGSAISSLDMIEGLPLTYLKLDGSYARRLESDAAAKAIISTVKLQASQRGTQVVACHVEKDSTLQMVRELGIELVQGHGVARPRSFACKGDER